jgi:exopolysaccharide biosynthesis polyprenyl glycosylphosphotransferase
MRLGSAVRRPVTAPLFVGRVDLPEGKADRTALLRDTLHRRLLAATDSTAAIVALVAGFSMIEGASFRWLMLLALPIVVLTAKTMGLYDRDEHLIRKTTLDEAPGVFQLTTLFTLLVWLGTGPLMAAEPSRASILVVWVLMLSGMLVGRACARRVALALSPAERCIVLGGADAAERIRRKLHFSEQANAFVVGRVPLDQRGELPGEDADVLGVKEELGLTLAEFDVERVIIAPSGVDSEQILDAIRLVKALGVKVSVVPRLMEVVGSTAEFDEIDGITLLGVRRYGLTRSSEVMKRTLDVTAAGLGLLILAPLMIGLSLAIRLGSSGPVLFRQPRIGRKGEEFWMLKFRTMHDGADAQKHTLRHRNETAGLFKIADDPRVTRVGRLLRRTSLDELPQLINVLRGDMSLVGPRPLVPDEDAQIEGWQRRRLLVRPGMTGLWQIFGSSRIPMNEMVKIDYFYGANWSLWGDLKILMRTVPYMLARRGM